jgi:putative nucleotidyltransferase with HDIG domain
VKQLTSSILDIFGEAHLVGGALRDAALRSSFSDIDLAVPGRSDFKTRVCKLSSVLNAACFPLDEENLVYRLKTRRAPFLQLDIAPYQGPDLNADLRRRDFTVNAMALPLERGLKFVVEASGAARLAGFERGKIIDPTGGLVDLKKKLLTAAGPRAFSEDPLRTLRAFRLAAQLGFKLPASTLKQLKASARHINTSSPERIHDELLLLLESPDSAGWLRQMHKTGLLCSIFPELAEQESCATAYYGRGGVLKHTFNVVERMDYLFSHLKEEIHGYKKIAVFFEKPAVMKLAALLHDVAKPAKAAMVKDRLRFFGHEEHGAVMCERIMTGLRFSREDIRLVSAIVGKHLRPGNLAANAQISDRAMFRFFRMMGEYSVPLIALCWADHASYIPHATLLRVRGRIKEKPEAPPSGPQPYNSLKKTVRFMQVLNLLLHTYVKKNIKLRTARLIDGHDVIRVLKLKESPRVGEILEKVQLLQFEGKVKTRAQALIALSSLRGFAAGSPSKTIIKE